MITPSLLQKAIDGVPGTFEAKVEGHTDAVLCGFGLGIGRRIKASIEHRGQRVPVSALGIIDGRAGFFLRGRSDLAGALCHDRITLVYSN